MSKNINKDNALSRRKFVQQTILGTAALTSAPILTARTFGANRGASQSGLASRVLPLDRDWLFGGRFNADAMAPAFNDAAFSKVTLPHCVTSLSWQNWDPAAWQDVWTYRRHFTLPPEFKGLRTFLHFDGVMVGATPTVNGNTLPQHLGGYLPFRYEITEHLKDGENVLALAVDSQWNNVPPEGKPVGAKSIDYLEAGGIHRSVRIEAVPPIFISDVFAKPVDVLAPRRRIDVTCTIDAAIALAKPVDVQIELRDGERIMARLRQSLRLKTVGENEVKLTLSNLGNIKLWHVDAPYLYNVVTTLFIDNRPVHDHSVRIGFREARFELNGFFLNGQRLQLFGLNRHEIFPYVGSAMPPRVKRRDAEILRRDFGCNIVRCSHYPQSEAFMDACDELGLMVWEEVPGWQYIGDEPWKELLLRDVKNMVVRDRNRPSVVIWGTRVNESPNDVELYRKTRELAKSLDDSRPTSGSMTPDSRKDWKQNWHEDVFAFDDYHAAKDGTVGIAPPVDGVPYMLAEAIGQFNYTDRKNFNSKYRRAGEVVLQQAQAIRHAQAHNKAAANPRICGVIAWCGFDYSSLVNPYNNLKCPGVADTFRIPKLGASFYLAQIDPKVRPVIQPNFYWDFGPQTPRGPGKDAAIFSNCDRLELLINGKHHATVLPDKKNYPHLTHPPFFTSFDLDGTSHPELRIDGYVGGRLALSKSFSSDPAKDQFSLQVDDKELIGDGADATRLVFKVTDKFGAERAFAVGDVSFEVSGPGAIIGDNPFSLVESGGVGAVWARTKAGGSGKIVVKARHSSLGTKSVEIQVQAG